jgi:hypothetical protein
MTEYEAHIIILKMLECLGRDGVGCDKDNYDKCRFHTSQKDKIAALNIASLELSKITGKLNLADELQKEEKSG